MQQAGGRVNEEASGGLEAGGPFRYNAAMGTDFPPGFLWGAATSAYQVEGAVGAGGRGETIWDRFTHTPGNVLDGATGDVACDHYHRWREDLDQMAELGLTAYRFSMAWARVFPSGGGEINAQGLDFYQGLVDGLLARRIAPVVTLYHWDLPQALQERGGWADRDTARRFSDYAYALFRKLGDRVKLWITHNEPWVTAFAGHEEGVHAPGIRDRRTAVQVSHHLLLSHAHAVRAFRDAGVEEGRVGISLNLYPVHASSGAAEDEEAARTADGHYNRWFLDAVLRGAYPRDMLQLYEANGVGPRVRAEDLEELGRARPDFLGVNYYTRTVVRAARKRGELFSVVPPAPGPLTEMGWEVFPKGLQALLLRLDREYGHPALYITENGAACPNRLEDDGRIEYLRGHLRAARQALREGVDLRGYFLWSLMDNFEWAFGFSRRFGILRTDFRTLRRQWRRSAFWYRDLIRAPESRARVGGPPRLLSSLSPAAYLSD